MLQVWSSLNLRARHLQLALRAALLSAGAFGADYIKQHNGQASVGDMRGNARTHIPGPKHADLSNQVRIRGRCAGSSFFHRFGDHG